MLDLQVGGTPLPPTWNSVKGKCAVFHAGNKLKQTKQKLLYKTPVAGSPCTPCRTLKIRKSDESQLATRDSVKPKRPPAHAFVCARVGHLPSAETNNATIVTLFVDEKVLRGAKNLVDSLVAVFADVGNTFKGSKNFADHIFYRLRLSGNKVHVKGKNFAVTIRNNFCRLETILGSFAIHSVKSFCQTFASVGKV